MTSHTDTSTTDLSDEHQDLLGTLAAPPLSRHRRSPTASTSARPD
ncbi:MAG: hypothetical protein R2705_09460 [Ilumatobacteraceae bacterium]